MCGIIGFNWRDKTKLLDSLNQILHRGPDNKGFFIDDHISLGHARLSIIDLTDAGNQPMHYTHNGATVTITYNGEIYNFQTIKEELKKQGYSFTSKSDTEVILASYLEYGTDCVKKFNGMWAFCIYDPEKGILFLSRDKLGQKPLHYYWDEEKFIFCSEIKGILQLNVPKIVNKEAIDFHFSLGFIPPPYSIYENIYKLEPRYNLVVNLRKNTIQKTTYFTLPKYKPEKNRKKLISEGRELLKDATRLRLIADVPIGAFLSGGLDSSVTVAEMAKFLDLKNLNTFSIGFEEKYDEMQYMNIVQEFFNTKHHHQYFSETDFENMLEEIFYYFDEPHGDFSLFPTVKVSKLARKFVTVSLSGDGGDEVFGGYGTPQLGAKMMLMRKMPRVLRWIGYKILQKTVKSPGFFSQLKEGLRISLEPLEKFLAEMRKDKEYKPEVFVKWITDRLKECLELSNGNLIEALMKLDYYYVSLPEYILLKVDRASMAYALEVRSPFLDYRFIDYSSRIPTKWKVNMRKKKILMRQIIKGIVPDEIVYRGKQGFSPPLHEWIIKDEYQKEIGSTIEEYHKKTILSKEWKKILDEALGKKDKTWKDKDYLIKMFLFGRWAKKWGI